ncbi:hypothetical protein A3A60_03195 [Candidatus Curtissbacteria bacterium RIFCSPLOWO2_01_FULL_42_26]|uniref:M23ase beta-sheet core domain-containing protein n=1 Tax=Candidatus Curtissbacteria bacterium RIFCSPLOWO2_01_FULL_42_26 TaxID=1797729 RepID=A0A1F5I2C8_9BACT|nr:MAG: hypothetical protein A3A60_03195 [Candidatus Curtissbacteria bacterium RIFCSPLOWO2_01_FULL_42_26]
MKIKIKLSKKTKEVPSRLRRKAYCLLRHNKSVLLKTPFVRALKRYARMELGRALKLFARFTHFQLSIRPRIRLIATVTLILMLTLAATNRMAGFVNAKEGEIKINGQAILVAQNSQNIPQPSQIEGEILSKKSPFDFVRPAQGYISQGFAFYHRAVDITDDLGAPIRPLGAGKVEFTGYMNDGHGNSVVVDHGDGLKSLYAHMSRIYVGVGNGVDSDTAIGTIGLTGRTTGPHVHVEVYDNGISVDPAKLLPE